MQDKAEPFVEPFLDLVKQMYANITTVVEKELSGKDGAAKVRLPFRITAGLMLARYHQRPRFQLPPIASHPPHKVTRPHGLSPAPFTLPKS